MRNTVLYSALILVLGIALGFVLFRGDPELKARLDAQRDSTALYRDSVAAVLATADSAEARMVVKIDTFIDFRTRWDTIRRIDTLTVPQVIAVADSTIKVCENALVSCVETVAAKDSAISVQEQRALILERYNDELADRLRKRERRAWLGTARDVAIGGGVVFLVCSLSGGC